MERSGRNNSLTPDRQLKRDLLGDTSSRGNDGLPRNVCSAGPTRIYVQDHPGAEPAIILMHGFPDNLHLYDHLAPYLSPQHRVVLFDFLGWENQDHRPAILTPPTIKLVTSTPSSPNWGSGESS